MVFPKYFFSRNIKVYFKLCAILMIVSQCKQVILNNTVLRFNFYLRCWFLREVVDHANKLPISEQFPVTCLTLLSSNYTFPLIFAFCDQKVTETQLQLSMSELPRYTVFWSHYCEPTCLSRRNFTCRSPHYHLDILASSILLRSLHRITAAVTETISNGPFDTCDVTSSIT